MSQVVVFRCGGDHRQKDTRRFKCMKCSLKITGKQNFEKHCCEVKK